MTVKPILKWAGGKTQMLPELLPRVPERYGKYIEPFFGGGALFFALQPKNAVIADSNPEIINVYQQVANDTEAVIRQLLIYKNTEECFYQVREQNWQTLDPFEAAARTIFLNKTCFNGLYRVNRKGQFNTPFGRYKNPKICDADALRAAAEVLRNATIICADYVDVLEQNAEAGDFVFLDPPYVPVSAYADFKRYTKEQFREDDHRCLAEKVEKLRQRGCYIIETNSSAPLVYELYSAYQVEVILTKRAISSKADTRTGEDVIITAVPDVHMPAEFAALSEQVSKYPPTRFMGSKSKLLGAIWGVAKRFDFTTALDLFSGSGVVSYMLKTQGKQVISNDYMAMSHVFAKAMVENSSTVLTSEEIEWLLMDHGTDMFVEQTFRGLYFSDQDNHLIDVIRANIKSMEDENKQALAMTALIRACTKKRPRGLFTYVGLKTSNDDGRRDLVISMEQQFRENANAVNNAVFDNGQENLSIRGDAMNVPGIVPDLVYMDPPYYSPLSDNEYVRRYHFLEGLACDWQGVQIQQHTKTKKFKSYPTPFSSRDGAAEAFDKLFEKYSTKILIVSYSSNSEPTKEEMIEIMKRHKAHVEVVPIDHTYSFGNQKAARTHRQKVQEYLFVGY